MVLISLVLALSGLGAAVQAQSNAIPPPAGPYGQAGPPPNGIRFVSAFYPTSQKKNCATVNSPYMPPATAQVYDEIYSELGLPNGTFGSIALTLCSAPTTCPSKHNASKYPVVVFSPGLSISRLIYNNMAASLASEGYIVITVDHPYDAAAVAFPDGSVVLAANISTDSQIESALKVRAADISFVTRTLQTNTALPSLLQGLAGSADLANIFLHGHSLGGATAAEAMRQNKQVRAGVNLDGTFFGAVVKDGLDRPFLIMAHEGKSLATDASWAALWARLRGPKLAVAVNGTTHGNYTDFPVLVDVLGVRELLPSEVLAPLVGTIAGQRMVEIVTADTKAFFKYARCRAGWGDLLRAVRRFAEVTVLDASEAERRG